MFTASCPHRIAVITSSKGQRQVDGHPAQGRMRSAGIGGTPGSTAVFDSATLQAEATALGTSAVGRLLAEDVERLQATNPAGEKPD